MHPQHVRGFSRLSLKLFLLLGMVSLLSIGSMALLMSRELEAAFLGYLNTVQSERLNAAAGALAGYYRDHGSFDELRPEVWRRLLGASAPEVAERVRRPPPPRGEPPPWRDGPPEEDGRPPPGPPEDGAPDRPPPHDPLGLGPRLSVYDAQGRRLIGPPPQAGASHVDIVVDGKTVGRLSLAPLVVVAEARDAQFLAVQKHSIATAAGIGLAISILLGFLVARLWVRRIGAVEHATARIAGGDFAIRIDDSDRDEIGALGRNVNRMAESLSQLEQARRKWLADIAHELRTPLTVLQAEIEALQDGVRTLDKSAMQSLADETRHLARLTDDLRLLALADMQALPMEWRVADAVDIAASAAARWQSSARKAGLALAFVAGAPANSLVDAGRLTQLFDNLLANSIRYTDAPGTLEVRAGAEGGRIRLTFDDSPPGLAPGERAGLFEPLYRPDAARSRAKGGSGLGLALARAIVQAHGGTIRAADSPLGGVRIAIDLPITTTPPK
ncbi:MAG: HAMP domain-containing protein [Betaproteobacteria bacterium]|nr:HAMP domain-containing protein [Betaproteobacteria bacterium]